MTHRLHDEIVAYVTHIESTPQEARARQVVFGIIEGITKTRFPDCKVNIFGSSATTLCLPTSDIHIDMSNKQIGDLKTTLFQLSSTLMFSGITQDVQVNHRARVPIVSFRTEPDYGSFNVDIGINNADGIQSIDITKGYLAAMPALRPLVLVIKGFLSQRGLNNAARSGLGSYAVLCMCISFLQLNPSSRPQDFIDRPMETESLGTLLSDFLLYYGLQFPSVTSYISVTEGKLLPKANATWINKEVPDCLSIQCLINPEHDIGKSANPPEPIRHAFKEGYTILLQRNITDPNSNVLFGILITECQETEQVVGNRVHIHELVESGKLDIAKLSLTGEEGVSDGEK